MCVYCKDAPDCDHERDSCAASQGERSTECGHSSAAFPPAATPAHGRYNWLPPEWPKQTPLTKAEKARPAVAKKRAKK